MGPRWGLLRPVLASFGHREALWGGHFLGLQRLYWRSGQNIIFLREETLSLCRTSKTNTTERLEPTGQQRARHSAEFPPAPSKMWHWTPINKNPTLDLTLTRRSYGKQKSLIQSRNFTGLRFFVVLCSPLNNNIWYRCTLEKKTWNNTICAKELKMVDSQSGSWSKSGAN